VVNIDAIQETHSERVVDVTDTVSDARLWRHSRCKIMAAMVSSEVTYAVGNLNGLEHVSQSPEAIRQEIWGFEHSRG
jgi:hypothetical protein